MADSEEVKNGNTQSWLRKVIASFSIRRTFQVGRLQAELGAYRAELAGRLLIKTAQGNDVVSSALSMVDQAQTALDGGKVDQAWLTYDAARRLEIESFDDKRLALHAASLLEESKKLTSKWRRRAIGRILEKPTEVKPASLRKAMEIRDQDLENLHFKVSFFANQLEFLSSIAAGFVGLIVLLAYNGAFSSQLDPGDWIRLIVVICYGAVGGTVSTMLSLTPKGIEPRIPVQIITGTLALARPILGATMAVAVDAFWRIGLITINAPPGFDYIAISFAAGFSDRLLLSAISKIPGVDTTKVSTPEAPEPGEDDAKATKHKPGQPTSSPGGATGGESKSAPATPTVEKAPE